VNKLLIFSLSAALGLSAGTINFGSDLADEGNNRDAENNAITPHPAWQANNPGGSGAFWISYRPDTGNNPSYTEPNAGLPLFGSGASAPSAIFWEMITVGGPGSGWVRVWADDTARVRFGDGNSSVVLFEANPVQDGACAAGPIGCEPSEGQLLNFHFDSAGDYFLYFDVFQRGGGPFGLLYYGEAAYRSFDPESTSETPEPGTYALMGAGLIGLALFRRRR
jgi:hypothetical protein